MQLFFVVILCYNKINMKKILITLLILSFFSAGSFAAVKYKVNTGGKVISPQGSVQTNSSMVTRKNLYNNYYAPNYVSQKQAIAQPVSTIDIVMDYSGSMAYWIEAAKNSMTSIVSQLPASTKVGFRVFGHDSGNNPYSPIVNMVKSIKKNKNGKYEVATKTSSYLGNISGTCSATSRIVPVMPYDAYQLIAGMNSVSIGGSTPLTLGLEQAVTFDFAGLPTSYPKKIILITDGGENCGGDPCAFARALVAKRKDIIIDVVLVSADSNALKCLADYTKGTFYNTDDISSFVNILQESMQNAPATYSQPSQKYEFIGN